jgi:hypothetical protein
MNSLFKLLRFVAIVAAFISAFYSNNSHAEELKNDTKITFDFSLRQVQFFGIYTPENGGKRGGLEAEITARRNGIANLNSKLTSVCKSGATEQNTSLPSWQGSVKSQGSEIFSNGVLKISLVAPLREVFKNVDRKPATLKTKGGSPLALKVPRLSLANIKCGLVSVSVGGKIIDLNPLSGASESGAKVVNLELVGGNLKPASAEDASLLENSNLFASVEPAVDAPEKSKDAPVSTPANAN